MIVRRQGDWLAARVGDQLVMMSAERGNYIGLSTVGARIWDLLAVPQTIDDVCAKLREEFDVAPDVCRVEVDAFLRDMELNAAIVLDQAGDS